jgi:hypothetical protein
VNRLYRIVPRSSLILRYVGVGVALMVGEGASVGVDVLVGKDVGELVLVS